MRHETFVTSLSKYVSIYYDLKYLEDLLWYFEIQLKLIYSFQKYDTSKCDYRLNNFLLDLFSIFPDCSVS